jgi:hypothetical protein
MGLCLLLSPMTGFMQMDFEGTDDDARNPGVV